MLSMPASIMSALQVEVNSTHVPSAGDCGCYACKLEEDTALVTARMPRSRLPVLPSDRMRWTRVFRYEAQLATLIWRSSISA